MTMKFVESSGVRAYPSGPPHSVTNESSVTSSRMAVVPLMAAAQNRQSQLVVEDTIKEARLALRQAADLVIERGWATSDTFVRHHLLSAAREISMISVALNSAGQHCEGATPCLVRTLDRELASVAAAYPERAAQISRGFVSLDIFPTWTAVFIFGLVVRILIHDAIQNTDQSTRLSVRFRRDREMLRFGIDGAGQSNEEALMGRICNPNRFRSLVSALSGRVESAPNGISIRMPVVACASLEVSEL